MPEVRKEDEIEQVPIPLKNVSHVIPKSEVELKELIEDLTQIGCVSRTSPKGYPKHHGHKGDPRVTPGTCGAGGERAQMILVWVRAPGIGNASHPRRLGVMRVRP